VVLLLLAGGRGSSSRQTHQANIAGQPDSQPTAPTHPPYAPQPLQVSVLLPASSGSIQKAGQRPRPGVVLMRASMRTRGKAGVGATLNLPRVRMRAEV
jgi:hypothetical protein